MTIFDVPIAVITGQLLLGMLNGSFYAMLSLGLAVIFGMLHVVNFAHGALYMLGAFAALYGLRFLGINYWFALILAPLAVGLFGALLERLLLRRIAGMDPIYGLLMTFGVTLTVEGLFSYWFGSLGRPYPVPDLLKGGVNFGFGFIPIYRLWVLVISVAVCIATWYLIERTRIGSYLRASTENAPLVQTFGVNVPLLVTLTYGGGVALAAFAGVLAAPIYQVSPHMGQQLIITVFAVVVIGGMGSILGSVITGFLLGIIEGLCKVFYPEGSAMIVFVVMILVLLVRPAGLFGRGD